MPSVRHSLIGCLAILKPVMLFPAPLGCEKCVGYVKASANGAAVRVIYFNRLENGEIWLLIVYAKAKFDNLPPAFLNKLKEEINDG